MKILLLLFLSLLLIFLPVLAWPVEIKLARSDYAAGETLQADILVDSIENELSVRDISLLDQDLGLIPITPFLNKIRKNYYIYFQIPTELVPGNYSLFVNDIVYYKNDLLIQDNFNVSFPILEKETVLAIDPGIVLANNLDEQNSFSIYLINKGDQPIGVSFNSDTDLIDLSSNNSIVIYDTTVYAYVSEILIKDYEFEFRHLVISYNNDTYDIPIWLGEREFLNESVKDEKRSFVYFLNENKAVNLSFLSQESKYLSVEFQNKGEFKVKDLRFYLQGNISTIADLEYLILNELNPGEIAKQNVFLNRNKNASGQYTGYLVMDDGNNVDDINLSFYFYDKFEQPVFDNTSLGEHIDVGNLEDYNMETGKRFKINYWILGGVLFAFVLAFVIIKYIRYKRTRLSFPPFHSF